MSDFSCSSSNFPYSLSSDSVVFVSVFSQLHFSCSYTVYVNISANFNVRDPQHNRIFANFIVRDRRIVSHINGVIIVANEVLLKIFFTKIATAEIVFHSLQNLLLISLITTIDISIPHVAPK